MTPRALVESGREGIGREVFPESAKEVGRQAALEPGLVQILKYKAIPDGGGDTTKTWIPEDKPVRGRLRSVRRLPRQQAIAGRTSEASTHLVELDPDANIDTEDRVEIKGQQYSVLSYEPSTEAPLLQVEVKEI